MRRAAERSSRARPTIPAATSAASRRMTGKPKRGGGGMPISWWTSRCQPEPQYENPASAIVEATASHRHARGVGRRSGRVDSFWISQVATTPSPYPAAADTPLMIP